MNLQERDHLIQFLKQLEEVRLTSKDPEAESLIRNTVAKQADAAYLLVQRTMLQEQALNNAKAQISELQNQLQNAGNQQRGGFLSNDPWAQPVNNGGVPGAGNYQVPRAAPAQSGFFGGGNGGGSSFLGNVATTAAGVVAGSFLFQGIENLMGHHGGASSWGQSGLGGEHPAEQTVINNYYGDDALQQANNEENNRNDYLVSDDSDSYQDDSDDSSSW